MAYFSSTGSIIDPRTGETVNVAARVDPAPLEGETVTVSDDVAKTLTALTYANALGATITVEDAQIRFWLHGDAPTSSAGHLLQIGDCINLQSPAEIAGFKAIATTTTDAVLQVSYWR